MLYLKINFKQKGQKMTRKQLRANQAGANDRRVDIITELRQMGVLPSVPKKEPPKNIISPKKAAASIGCHPTRPVRGGRRRFRTWSPDVDDRGSRKFF